MDMCLALPSAEATSPFGPQTVVFKVAGKMFALLSLDSPRLNLKCDPDRAQELRERYEAVEPGWHMSKKHWNSIYWEREVLGMALLAQWTRHSYDLVVASLPKAVRATLTEA